MKTILFSFIFFAISGLASAQSFTSGGLYFNINPDNSSCMVAAPDNSDFEYSGSIEIPSTVDYQGDVLLVTGIDSYAFAGAETLTSISIPESVTGIGRNAFYNCTALTHITLPSSISSIEEETFYRCSSLESVEFGELTAIKRKAFSECNSLTKLTLPPTLNLLGEAAFRNCANLVSINLNDGLSNLGEQAFEGCVSLSSIIIPEGIATIPAYAFQGCTSLATVELHEEINVISQYSFYGCSSLLAVDIPSSVTEIGENAFGLCSSLSNLLIESQGNLFIDKYAFYYCKEIETIELTGVVEIGSNAFANNVSLKNIILGESLKEIGSSAFAGCMNIETIMALPNIPPLLANHAFSQTNYENAELIVPYQKGMLYAQTPPWNYFLNISELSANDNVSKVENDGFVFTVSDFSLTVISSSSGIDIYSINGAKILHIPKVESPQSFALPGKGIYILVTADTIKKLYV